MRRRLTAIASITASFVAPVACNAILGISEREPFPADAATSDVSPGGDAASPDSADGSAEAAGDVVASDATTCAGPIVYVSTSTGDDANPGCSSSAPKKTIAAALATAKASGTTAVEVCKGTYAEHPLALDFPASLRGSYDCGTWTRTPTYGYPTFDGTNATIVTNANTSISGNTLAVSGAAITPSFAIDGLTIQGAASGAIDGSANAVLVENSAAPVLSNDQLSGGGTTAASGLGSAGVVVGSGAAPLVKNDVIDGGSGTAGSNSNNASVGIYTDGTNASFSILGNTINGGTGTGLNTGSAAIYLQATGTATLTYTVQGNVISAGTGTSNGSGQATTGVTATGNASLTLEGNSIDGGGGTSGMQCSYGVRVQLTGSVTIASNRIYGGVCNIPNPAAGVGPGGVVINGVPASLEIVNNMIHAGSATTTGANVGGNALNVAGAIVGPVIRHNTVIGGLAPAGSGALYLHGGVTGAVIENNVLAVTSTASAEPLTLTCNAPDGGQPVITSFSGNLLVGALPGPYSLLRAVTCEGGNFFGTIDAMTLGLQTSQVGVDVHGNVTMAPSCGTDSGCIVAPTCTTEAACVETLLAGWDVGSDGYANLFDAGAPFTGTCPPTAPPAGNGWPLAPTAPCAVARSSVDDNASVTMDLYGDCRKSGKPSMGAAESTADAIDGGACTPAGDAGKDGGDAGPSDASSQ